MRWLHLSDLHIGRPHPDQDAAIRSLVRKIGEDVRDVVDAIILTGDLTFSGTTMEFSTFHELVLAPLKALPAFASASVLAVPGNHDLDCDDAYPISWDGLGTKRQSKFFLENPDGRATRKRRAEAFRDFENFALAQGIIAPLPSNEVCCHHRVQSGNNSVDFFLANTAFFSDKEVSDQEKTPAPTRSLVTRLDEVESQRNGYAILLGHHPPDWFIPSDRQPFRTLLRERRLVYLHGHMHDISTTFNSNGVERIGFGAAYQDSQWSKPKPYYRNTYAVCALDEGLHIKFNHWDCENGRWVQTTTLPADFSEESKVLASGHRLHLQQVARPAPQRSASASSTPALRRLAPEVDSIITLSEMKRDRWFSILADLQLCPQIDTLRPINDEGGVRLQFEYRVGEARHWILCIGAPGNILTRAEVEQANNMIDYEELASYTILTIGSVAQDGEVSYHKLKKRKPLHIVSQAELATGLLSRQQNPKLRSHIESLDASDVDVRLVSHERQMAILFFDKQHLRWFYLLDTECRLLDESDTIVTALREHRSSFRECVYSSADSDRGKTAGLSAPVVEFNEEQYRSDCFRSFNSVKYAALATLGLRLSKLTLEDLYISATADPEGKRISDVALNRAVDDALQGIVIPPHLRAKLKTQIRNVIDADHNRGGEGARALYQECENLLVLGDPGSGKTCFVKYELLSYCQIAEKRNSWYQRHVPLYVNLSEAAALVTREDGIDLLSAAAQLAARAGLVLPIASLKDLEDEGRVAFFFDGLDEVSALDQREKLFDLMLELIARARKRGNRCILTSRPAAMQMLDIPGTLRKVTLRGLSTPEMQDLAHRILKLRVAEAGLTFEKHDSTSDDDSLVARLLNDCEQMPGLGRLARNPLLFTLLTMSYANHGPLGAKRHRVYHQAIQTLVSARSRSIGHRVFSEADLRRRLGSVAFAVFDDPAGTVPSWSESVECIRRIMAAEASSAIDAPTVESFLRQVAESTGILVLHPKQPGEPGDGNITFMHYSFMEYYAAIGLGTVKDTIKRASDLSRIPRWREVIMLYAGIIGDQDVVTPFVVQLLGDQDSLERITLDRIILAIEASLESEVPPEHALNQILSAIEAQFDETLLLDDELRGDIGGLLAKLVEATGGAAVSQFLERGLTTGSKRRRAAFADILGHVTCSADVEKPALEAFFTMVAERDKDALVGICAAAARSSRLLRELAERKTRKGEITMIEDLLKFAFGRGDDGQFAAVQLVEQNPELARQVWDKLSECLRSSQPHLVLSAALSIIKAGWTLAPDNDDASATLLLALQRIVERGQPEHITLSGKTCDWFEVRPMLSAADTSTRLFGIFVLPWVRNAEAEVFGAISDILRNVDTPRAELIGAMGALRLSVHGRQILRLADVDAIQRLLGAKNPRDIRMSAARLLGEIDKPQVTEALLTYADEALDRDTEEYRIAVRSLAHRTVAEEQVLEKLASHWSTFFTNDPDGGARMNSRRQSQCLELLRALTDTEFTISESMSNSLWRVAIAFKVPIEVRTKALVAYGWQARPTAESMRNLLGLLSTPPPGVYSDLLDALLNHIRRASRRLESMRAVDPYVDELKKILVRHRRGMNEQSSGFRTELDVKNTRGILQEVERMSQGYKEFAARHLVT